MDSSIGRKLEHYRRLAQLPQYVVARAVGRSGAWLSLVENGALQPTREQVERIAQALGLTPEALFK